MNINSKKPQHVCAEIRCSRRWSVKIQMESGTVLRLCQEHAQQSFKKAKPKARA